MLIPNIAKLDSGAMPTKCIDFIGLQEGLGPFAPDDHSTNIAIAVIYCYHSCCYDYDCCHKESYVDF